MPSIAQALADLQLSRLASPGQYETRHEPRGSGNRSNSTLAGNTMLPIVNVLEHVLKLRKGLTARRRIDTKSAVGHSQIQDQIQERVLTKVDRSGREPCLEDLYLFLHADTSAMIRSG